MGFLSQPHAVQHHYHSGPSPTANLPLLKLRLALSGSGSRNDPLHMLAPCTPRLLPESALLSLLAALLVLALAASECCYLLACPL